MGILILQEIPERQDQLTHRAVSRREWSFLLSLLCPTGSDGQQGRAP